MDDDRKAAATERAEGSVKEAIGKLTGDAAAEAKGRAQKAGAEADTNESPAEDAAREHDPPP